MLEKLRNLLNEPYPDRDDWATIFKDGLIAGGIVFIVLALYAPFGLDKADGGLYLNSFYFGVITFSASIFFEYVLHFLLKVKRGHPKWTLWKWIASTICLVLFIALCNYLFSAIAYEGSQFSFKGFTRILYQTFAVAIIPIPVFGVLKLNRQRRINSNLADNLEKEETIPLASSEIQLPVKDSQKTLSIDASKIVYVEAMQNYVLINHLNEEGKLEKQSHRNTFISVVEKLEQLGFRRTHRSFLVNPSMIQDIKGNAQGLKLTLAHLADGYVPVSRKYVSVFRKSGQKS